jgi:predicted SnoaL-like aldol condensation-catalyzing enzyme
MPPSVRAAGAEDDDMATTTQTSLATDFLAMVCDGRVDEAYATLVAPGFRHHNPWFRADADALRQGMADNAAKFPDKRMVVHRTLEDGDEVVVHSHVRHTPQERGYALVHWFRFEGGRIAELWDLAQEVPAQSANALGMF